MATSAEPKPAEEETEQEEQQEEQEQPEEKKAEGLSRSQKAAILVMSMGAEAAGQIFRYLSEDEVEELTAAITSIQSVDEEVRLEVLSEFLSALKSRELGHMGGMQAASTVVQIQVAALEKKGHKVDKAEYDELLKTIKKAYEDQTDPRWAASRGWVDRIVDPVQTRADLSLLLEAVSRPGPIPPFRVGALQT